MISETYDRFKMLSFKGKEVFQKGVHVKMNEKKLNRLIFLFIIIASISSLLYYSNSFRITMVSSIFLAASIASFFVLMVCGGIKLYIYNPIKKERKLNR